MKVKLVVPDVFRPLSFLGSSRPLGMETELHLEKLNAEVVGWSFLLLNLFRWTGKQRIGVGGLTWWLLTAVSISDYGWRCGPEDKGGQDRPQSCCACQEPSRQVFGVGELIWLSMAAAGMWGFRGNRGLRNEVQNGQGRSCHC